MDSQNAHVPNVVVGLTSHAHGGGTWLRDVGGTDSFTLDTGVRMQGTVYDAYQKPLIFTASRIQHAGIPPQQSDARRVILVAFCTKNVMNLAVHVRSLMLSHGFCLPTEAQHDFYKQHLIRPGQGYQTTIPHILVRSRELAPTPPLVALDALGLRHEEAIEVASSDETAEAPPPPRDDPHEVNIGRGLIDPPPPTYVQRLLEDDAREVEQEVVWLENPGSQPPPHVRRMKRGRSSWDLDTAC